MVYNCSLMESSYDQLTGRNQIKELCLGYAAPTSDIAVKLKDRVWPPYCSPHE